MGLFQHKQKSDDKSPIVKVFEDEKNFFDEDFRAEIRDHARNYFEKIISENVVIFKQDLDAAVVEIKTELKEQTMTQLTATIAEVNGELKERTLKQLDERFAAYGKEMKDAQDATIESLNKTNQEQEQRYKELNEKLQKNVDDQATTISDAAKANTDQVEAMKASQQSALDLLNSSVQALQEQSQQLRTMLQKNIVDQEAMLMTAFQDNMAQIIEHYLLGALGDQFDMRAQLPSIIKQMEENKQAMSDDMKL